MTNVRLSPCARGRCRHCQAMDGSPPSYPPAHVYDVACFADGRRWVAAVYRDGRRLTAGGSALRFDARKRVRALRRAGRYVDGLVAADSRRVAEGDADADAGQRFHAFCLALADLA